MSKKTDDMVGFVWRQLGEQISQAQANAQRALLRSEQAPIAQGVQSATLANAPALAGTLTDGVTILFISNGRKSGEGVGAGTGVLAYYNPATSSWFRTADDTAVVV
jgi:hypothetical protein